MRWATLSDSRWIVLRKHLDATGAPILLINGVGGYFAFRNTGVPQPWERRPDAEAPDRPTGLHMQLRALGAGLVVVLAGARGRNCVSEDGRYYGKAPAAIVDLKAAVRFIRHNAGRMPGDPERIITLGASAGGALSMLIGASANHPAYNDYLQNVGAAQETDHVFACVAFSPVFDCLSMPYFGYCEQVLHSAICHRTTEIGTRFNAVSAAGVINIFGKSCWNHLSTTPTLSG